MITKEDIKEIGIFKDGNIIYGITYENNVGIPGKQFGYYLKPFYQGYYEEYNKNNPYNNNLMNGKGKYQ